MPKKIMQDMKSKGVRITRISRKEENSKDEKNPSLNTEEYLLKIEDGVKSQNHIVKRESKEKIYSTPQTKKGKTYISRPIKILFMVSILIGGVYFVSNTFEKTNILIKEKTVQLVLDKEQLNAFIAKDAPVNFELMILPETESKDIVLSDSENVSIKAHGEVIFYNEFSTKPQKLLVHTFISDKSGKAYQTDNVITIPGYKLDQSKKIIPGQISTGITSFLPGSSYNGAPADFSVNLFKGTAKEKKIYAKLKSPLIGGAEGLVYKPSPQDMGILNAYALSTFKSNLLKKVTAQVPPGYVLYDGAMNVSSKVEENILSSEAKYKAKISGTVSSVILNKESLSKALVKKLLPNLSLAELSQVKIGDISNLVFNFTNPTQAISKDLKSVSFTLTGTVNPIWYHDIETLKKNFAGVSKTNIQEIFKSDPGIISASVKIFPPWNKYLPNDTSKININIE